MTRSLHSRLKYPGDGRSHDAGGKIKLPLLRGCRGSAEFTGPNEEFRPWLGRDWVPVPAKLWLWVGANPSTAAKDIDDPTIRKELKITIRDGGRGYRKANVMDYRATIPKDLHSVERVRSDGNLAAIARLAAEADTIVCAWGVLHPNFQRYADEAREVLLATGKRLYCVGYTADGHPRHPLYVKDAVKLERWP